MGTTRPRNDFINFIIDAEKDQNLAAEFLKKKNAKELYSFFQRKLYKDIPFNDCHDIIMARTGMGGKLIPRVGQGNKDCPPGQKVY